MPEAYYLNPCLWVSDIQCPPSSNCCLSFNFPVLAEAERVKPYLAGPLGVKTLLPAALRHWTCPLDLPPEACVKMMQFSIPSLCVTRLIFGWKNDLLSFAEIVGWDSRTNCHIIQTVKLIGVGSLAFFAVALNCWHRVKKTWAAISAITACAPGRWWRWKTQQR